MTKLLPILLLLAGCDFEPGICRTIRVTRQCLAEPNCRVTQEQLNYYYRARDSYGDMCASREHRGG